MARPRDVMHGLGRALTTADRLPELSEYTVVLPDGAGRQADLSIPFAEIRSVGGQIRQDTTSTALVRYITGEEYPDYLAPEYEDEYGEGDYAGTFDPNDQIGRMFEAVYEMEVDLTVWDFETDTNTIEEIEQLAERVETTLWRYDSQLRDDLLPSGDGTGIGAVTDLFVGDRELTEDVGENPTLRGSRQDIDVRFAHRLDTVAEYGPGETVKAVNSPPPDGFYAATDEEWEIEYRPPSDLSTAIESDFDLEVTETTDSTTMDNTYSDTDQWTLRNE